MNTQKQLVKSLAVAAAITALCGTSAFADSRHHGETKSDHRSSHVERSDRGDRGGSFNRGQINERNSNWNRGNTNFERNSNWNRDRVNVQQRDTNWNRGTSNFDRGRVDSFRSGRVDNFRNGRVDNFRGGRVDNFRGRTPSFYNGRITRYEPFNGGFRIWLGGAPYPFFVPEAYFRSHGFRVGLSIRLGGFYNPLGYYDYYDPYYYDGGGYAAGPYYGSTVTSGDVRGVVESVDWRRGTLVLRDDVSGNFVTVQMRGSDRMLDSLRTGDYVDLQGDWLRGGVFEAYRADLLDNGNTGRY